MLYSKKPNKFNPAFEVVSCIFSHNDEILLLKRSDKVEFPGTYGAPTGKMNKQEKMEDAMKREITEETGLIINKKEFQFLKTFFVKYPHYDFVYHLYTLNFVDKPNIKLNTREHVEYKWVKQNKAFTLPLVPDMQPCLEFFYKWKKD